MKNIIIKSMFLILFLCSINQFGSAKGYGTAGAQILNVYSSARIVGMGGAYAGLSDDLNAITYNPAGLANIYGTQIQFSRLVYFLDTNMNSIVLGQSLGNIGLGLKIKIFSAEDKYRDVIGFNPKTFKITYSQYTFGLGIPIYNSYTLGASMNIVSEIFDLSSIPQIKKEMKGSVTGFDIGILYKAKKGASYGVVLRNIGSDIKIDRRGDALPLNLVFGGGHKMGRFILTWEMLTGRQKSFVWKSGIEVDLKDFKLRGGFNYVSKPDLTVGFGVPYRNFSFDYAFIPHQDLGIAHRLTLGVNF